MQRPALPSSLLFGLLSLATGVIQAAPPDLASKQVPDWAADAVWYQIFPERFRNGDPKNDPTRASRAASL